LDLLQNPLLGQSHYIYESGIYNGAISLLQTVCLKSDSNLLYQFLSHIVGFHKVEQLENGRLIRRQLFAQIDSGKVVNRA